jgi:hypothetical protein
MTHPGSCEPPVRRGLHPSCAVYPLAVAGTGLPIRFVGADLLVCR